MPSRRDPTHDLDKALQMLGLLVGSSIVERTELLARHIKNLHDKLGRFRVEAHQIIGLWGCPMTKDEMADLAVVLSEEYLYVIPLPDGGMGIGNKQELVASGISLPY